MVVKSKPCAIPQGFVDQAYITQFIVGCIIPQHDCRKKKHKKKQVSVYGFHRSDRLEMNEIVQRIGAFFLKEKRAQI